MKAHEVWKKINYLELTNYPTATFCILNKKAVALRPSPSPRTNSSHLQKWHKPVQTWSQTRLVSFFKRTWWVRADDQGDAARGRTSEVVCFKKAVCLRQIGEHRLRTKVRNRAFCMKLTCKLTISSAEQKAPTRRSEKNTVSPVIWFRCSHSCTGTSTTGDKFKPTSVTLKGTRKKKACRKPPGTLRQHILE